MKEQRDTGHITGSSQQVQEPRKKKRPDTTERGRAAEKKAALYARKKPSAANNFKARRLSGQANEPCRHGRLHFLPPVLALASNAHMQGSALLQLVDSHRIIVPSHEAFALPRRKKRNEQAQEHERTKCHHMLF